MKSNKEEKKEEKLERWQVLNFKSAREYDGWRFMNSQEHDVLDEIAIGDYNNEYL